MTTKLKKTVIFTFIFSILVLPLVCRGNEMVIHKLELYYSPYCPYCQRVTDVLKKENLHIPLVDVNTTPGARQTLRQKGGKVQVPCLFIDDQPLYESQDIIRWIQAHKAEVKALEQR